MAGVAKVGRFALVFLEPHEAYVVVIIFAEFGIKLMPTLASGLARGSGSLHRTSGGVVIASQLVEMGFLP